MTPQQAQLQMAASMRQLRVDSGITQIELSQKSGVALASLRKFERTGQISLTSLLKIAVILQVMENIVIALKPQENFKSIEQILKISKKKPRKRAR